MPSYNPNAKQPTYEIIRGTFPFEIVAVDQRTSGGQKTNGYPARELKLDVFKDTTFEVKIASINDTLIDHPNCDWKFSVLAKCVGAAVKPGEAFDIDEGWIGFRGYAEFDPEPDQKDLKDPVKKNNPRLWNRVKAYITTGQQLPKNANPKAASEPHASEPTGGDENNPFN